MVDYTLRLGALFLIGLSGSVCILNISTSQLNACSFSAPMGENRSDAIGSVRASTRYRDALVVTYLEEIPGIFVCARKNLNVSTICSDRDFVTYNL